MMAISKEVKLGNLRATQARENAKLVRQLEAVEVTKSMLEMIASAIEDIEKK